MAKAIPSILSEVASHGKATVKRIYADWTADHNRPWKAMLQEHSIQPIQQFQNTKGKNATDSALIIDAMDLLHGGNLEGFCLVSSDSDFSRLASRLREDGHLVLGFGEKKTPVAFVSSCDEFLYTCALLKGSGGDEGVQKVAAAAKNIAVKASPKPSKSEAQSALIVTLEAAFRKGGQAKGGWVSLSKLGTNVRLVNPQFSYKKYGRSNMSKLLLSMPDKYEVKLKSKGDKVARAKPTKG